MASSQIEMSVDKLTPISNPVMSVVGTKRQFARCKAMSGVGDKADLPVERPDFSV